MSRYKNTGINKSKITVNRRQKVLKYNTTVFDPIPERNDDIFVIAQEGDRLDTLASQFYGDSHLWWFIAKANNIYTMNIPAETSLRIPISIENAKGD